MENEKELRDYSDAEKGAYLGAIASIATADRQATDEEIEYLDALADAADLSSGQKEAISQIAKGISPDDLRQCLDVLKNSGLKYSLMTDIIAFAKSDTNYSDAEKNNIDNIAQYLDINQEQVSALQQFVTKTAESGQPPEEINKPGFIDSLGLGNVFKNSGLTSNILRVAGPMLLGALLSRGLGGRKTGGGVGGMLGGAGGMLGGAGGMLGGGGGMMSGGLGGLLSMLSGGRGFSNSGGLLSGIFGR